MMIQCDILHTCRPLQYEEPVRVTLRDLPTANKGEEFQEAIEADHDYEVVDNNYTQAVNEGEAERAEVQVLLPKLEPVQLQLQLMSSAGDYDCPAAVIPEATLQPVSMTMSLQENEAYGLVFENTQNLMSPSITECMMSEPITQSASDPYTTDNASKDEHSPAHEGPQLHTAEHLDLCITAENINTRDGKSDSEHQLYEKVCTYEKVQSCDIDHLLKVAHYQGPSLHGTGEASGKDCNDDSMGTTGSDGKTGTTSNPTESLDSYEQVWGYERVYHCDLPLEDFVGQKNDDTTSVITRADDIN